LLSPPGPFLKRARYALEPPGARAFAQHRGGSVRTLGRLEVLDALLELGDALLERGLI
jgi:hypothetical protein